MELSKYQKKILRVFKNFLIEYGCYSYIKNIYDKNKMNLISIIQNDGPVRLLLELTYTRRSYYGQLYCVDSLIGELNNLWLLTIIEDKEINPFHRIDACKAYNAYQKTEKTWVLKKNPYTGRETYCQENIDKLDLKETIRQIRIDAKNII